MPYRLKPIFILAVALVACFLGAAQAQTDNVCFIHHSCGANWLNDGLRAGLDAKAYIDEVSDITYGDAMAPDSGRPDSLGATEGDHTNMNHWIRWFNDYLGAVKNWECATGENRIVMFKSCYPISSVTSEGSEPGDPFSSTQSLANYRAVYRHPSGPGNTYLHDTATYKSLEDIFAENPDTLFIAVTAPPLVPPATNVDRADRARAFNNWLKRQWLASYNAAHPGLNNVAVYDWFDFLALPHDDLTTETYEPAGSAEGVYPVRNMTRLAYRRSATGSDSHPNQQANQDSTLVFATAPGNFIDKAWVAFQGNGSSGYSGGQAMAVASSGNYFAAAWGYDTGEWLANIDASGDSALPFPFDSTEWSGLFLYDYGDARYVEGLYALCER